MKLLIIGCNGQLGTDCRREFADAELLSLDFPAIDITRRETIFAAVEDFRPEAIINCAAFTAVDKAETCVEESRRLNAEGPANVVAAAAGARVVHISTDYVFDGELPPGELYDENSPTNPQSVYGRTKLAGEAPVLDYSRGAVLRTAWLYGACGNNFPRTMLRLAKEGKALRVVSDQFGSPTSSAALAHQIRVLLENWRPGLYHATSQGVTTWYDFAKSFLELSGVPFSIAPISTSEFPTPARRPKNSALDNRNLRGLGIDVMPDWRESLAHFVESCNWF